MKKIIFSIIIVVMMISTLSSQSDSTYIEQINDSTFVKVKLSFDDQGRETYVQKQYYDSIEFQQICFDDALQADEAYYESIDELARYEKEVRDGQKRFRQLRKIVNNFPNGNYNSKLTFSLSTNMIGDWKLKIGNTNYDISVNAILIAKDEKSQKTGRLIFKDSRTLQLRKQNNNDNFFFDTTVELFRNEKGWYIGESQAGERIVLRR